MQDPRLQAKSEKTGNFFWNLFESNDIKRTIQPEVRNNMGIRLYVDDIRTYKRLENLLDKRDGKFCWCETLTANYARFIFQWVDAISSRIETPSRIGWSLSQGFLPAFAGGLINAGTIIGTSHLAATRSRNDNGINLARFWLYSQFYTLMAVPVTAMAEKLLNPNTSYAQGVIRAIHPARLFFNASFAFAIGANNSQSEIVRLLYWPSIVAAAMAQRFANILPSLNTLVKSGAQNQLPSSEPLGVRRLELGRGGWVSVGAFSLLNFLFPVVLPQAKTYKEINKEYFDYVQEINESEI